MARFRYLAIAADGGQRHGLSDLPDEAAVVASLRSEGLLPVSVLPAQGSRLAGLRAGLQARPGGPALRRSEMVAMVRDVALMLGAGQDLDRALRYVADADMRPGAKTVLGRLRDRVRDGRSLADAMGEAGRSFSRLHVGLVRAGEASGTLGAVLSELAALLERQAKQNAAIRTAMIYPALLFVASVGAIVLLLTDILPQFVPLFAENGATLPTPTRIVIAAGDLVGRFGLWAVLIALLVGFLGRMVLRNPEARLWADAQILRLPVVGGLVREVLAARLCRTLGTLLSAGVALVPALVIVREVLGNTVALAALDKAALQVRQGQGLVRPLRGLENSARIFPRRMLDLLALGEETAQLGPLALRAAVIHEDSVQTKLQRLTALLVPGITVVMGALVAGIVSALLLAMIGLNDLAQ